MSNINIPTQVSPFVNRSQFPALGKTRVIYIDQTANVAYYWNNTSNAYVELGAAVAVNWGDITGTLADQTDLQNALDDLVPYSGATQDVNLGEHDLSVRKIFLYDEPNGNFGSIHYTDGNFHIEDADGHKLFVVEDGFLQLHLTDTIQSNLFLTLLTVTRDHYLPNQSGTIALTSDITGINSGTNTGDQDLSGLTPKTRTISTTAPLTGGGDLTSDRTLSIPQSTSAVDGYLSAADWTIFNGKQNALGFTPVPTTRTLTINGTTQDLSADRTFTISTGITIGTTAITSGTVGRVLFEGTGNVVSESANLFWDNTNGRLGIGTSSPTAVVHSVGSVTASSLIARGNYIQPTLIPNANNSQLIGLQVDISASAGGFTNVLGWGLILGNLLDNNLRFQRTIYGTSLRNSINSYTAGTANNSLLLQDISSGTTSIGAGGGNVLIGTTTDAGFKLDVNGTARIVTSLVVGGTGSGSLTTSVVRCNYLNTSDNGFSVMQLQTLSGNATFFQSVSIGSGANPIASAQLEVSSTTKGFLPPRMTTTQKNAIASPATGLMVYDTTLNLMALYNGTTWTTL